MKELNGFNCKEVKDTVFYLMKNKLLQGKVFVAGGIVPYIYSGRDSGRKHTDIDIVVKHTDMPAIRSFLKEEGCYQEAFDSVLFSYNTQKTDYGIEAFIQNIPVNFAPYEVSGSNILQRNFSLKTLSGFDGLLQVTMENIKEGDYITAFVQDGVQIGSYTLEMVQSAKENSDREKDKQDILEIAHIGLAKQRYKRVKPAVQNMKTEVITPEGAVQF